MSVPLPCPREGLPPPPPLCFGGTAAEWPCPGKPSRRPACSHRRENVLKNLDDKAFDKPICEALLNQKFFNGIGNYLRAEILYRWV